MNHDRMSDAELIAAVRQGDSDAYGVLYERHLHAAKRAASCLANTGAEREDLVADAFTKVLRALRDGGGPREEFRAYLLVTLRNTAISTSRGASVSLYADVPESYLPRSISDPVVNRWDANAAANAFASLPERWRTVLWHTEVEDESPAEIAPLLGLRPNGVAALAYRAREGLRQAYLRAHLPEVESRECRATVSKLAGWVRRSVPDPLSRKISRHLAGCPECRERADTLETVNEELRATVAPLLLGASFAAAYLPTVAAPTAVAKTLLAKAAVVAAIAATAVTTVASAPNPGLPKAGADVPALAETTKTTETTIHGPAPAGTTAPAVPADPAVPPTPATGPVVTVPPSPTPPGASDGPDTPGGSGASGGSGGSGSPGGPGGRGPTGPPPGHGTPPGQTVRAEAQERQAEKAEAREARQEAKDEQKAEQKAEKGK